MSELKDFQDAVIARNVVARVVEAGMVAKDPAAVGQWLLENVLKVGQKVQVWTGRGKQDYHEGVVADAKFWPKPGDKAFIRDNLTGRVTRKDEYTIKFEREPAYPGEPREALLKVDGIRSGEGAMVSFGKARERVYKLSVG